MVEHNQTTYPDPSEIISPSSSFESAAPIMTVRPQCPENCYLVQHAIVLWIVQDKQGRDMLGT